MAEKVPQNLSNHTRFDPLFHFFILPVFFITFISTIVHLVRHPGLHSAWLVVFMLAAALAVTRMRTYAIKVQDRVIRLEERLRLAILLDGPMRSRITEFSESQLIGLRFASDAELPAMAARTLSEKLSKADIKKAIVQWRPDYWRV
jgi:isocitrate lyase